MSAPWRQLRDLEPPLGSKRRVLERIEDRRAMPRRRRVVAWAASAAVVAAVVAVVLGTRGQERVATSPPPPTALPTPAPAPIPPPTAPPPPTPSPAPAAVHLQDGDTMNLTLAAASVEVTGPATLRTTDAGVGLDRGEARVDGTATIDGAQCRAHIDGRATVRVSEARMQVHVFAGTAEVTSVAAHSSCTVLQAERPKPTRAPPPPAPPPSHLRQQLDAFRAARTAEPATALAAYISIRDTWPDTPLREEIDAAIVDAHVALGHTAAARAAARAFLVDYPQSARTDAMRTLVGEQAQ